MAEPLFDRRYVYPSDEIGPYVELVGEIVGVGDIVGDEDEDVAVRVRTDRGEFTGYHWSKYPPRVGQWARIRVYDAGGGWYPDNRIMGFAASREMMS